MTADLTREALDLARCVLEAHEHVGMDTPEDKALHARACEVFRLSLVTIESRAQERT